MKRLLLCCSLFWVALAQADNDAIAAGRELYLKAGGYGCHVCHGLVAHGAGQAGGNIRGASLEAFELSLQENAPMQPLATVLDETQRGSIVTYLESLALVPLLHFNFEAEQWSLTAEPFSIGQAVDIVAYNASFSEQILPLSHLGLEDLHIAPLDTVTLRWQANADTDQLRETGLFTIKP